MLWTLVSLLLQHIILAYSLLSAIVQSQHFRVEFFFLLFFFPQHLLTIWFIPLQLPLALDLLFLFLTFFFPIPFIALLVLVKWCSLPFKQLWEKFKTCIWLSNCLISENSELFSPGFITLRQFAVIAKNKMIYEDKLDVHHSPSLQEQLHFTLCKSKKCENINNSVNQYDVSSF